MEVQGQKRGVRGVNDLRGSSSGALAQDLLVLRAVGKRWSGLASPILAGVEFSISEGQVVSIRGCNGAGKTTLLRIVAGLLVPDSGSVRVAGLDPERDRREFQQRVGLVSAGNGALYARLTVDDHLDLCSRLALLPRARIVGAKTKIRAEFELDELRNRRPDRLSTGQRQRLRLALGFLHEPLLVLLDEPAVSLDETARGLLEGAISSLRERGGAAIVCGPTGTAEALTVDESFVLAQGRLEPA